MLRSHQTRIRVVGCGGGGNNTISRLTEVGVSEVETLAINTDAQDLLAANAGDKILIGKNITKGLGAGSNPQIGEDSARENQQEIEAALQNTDMVFVTCGLGGGTGTGSAPVVAEISKKLGALTIGVVTLPFAEEGIVRWENARLGLEKLRQNSDTIIVIQNDRLFEVVPDLPLGMAFKYADEILVNAVKGITELITEKGLVNLDFADVRAIMQNGGTAMIGIGESDGTESAQAAAELAMQNKLLDIDITGAKSALINVTGGAQMPLKDAKRVMQLVAEKLDSSAKLIWGARIDPSLDKSVRVMLIATGLPEKRQAAKRQERQPRAETITLAPHASQDQSPDNDGIEQNLSVIGQLVESLAPEVQILTAEETPHTGDGVALDQAVEPAEIKLETLSANPETLAPISESSEKPKRKRKTKAAKSPKSSQPVVAAPQDSVPVQSTTALSGQNAVANAVSEETFVPQKSELVAPSGETVDKLDEAPPAAIAAMEQAASVIEAEPQRRPMPDIPAAAPKPKAPPASYGDVSGKTGTGVPPRLRTSVPPHVNPAARPMPPANTAPSAERMPPHVNPATRPLNAARGTPPAAKPQTPPLNRGAAGRGLNAPRVTPPGMPRAAFPGRETVRGIPNAGSGPPPREAGLRPQTPMVNRLQAQRASNGQPPQSARPRPPAPHGAAPSGHSNLSNPALRDRPQPPIHKPASVANNAANYNKLFEEKSLANLQTIRESIGHLFIDPARQETLRCMKNAATAINNLAQRFVFKEIADYATTVERICARVLDGEINMNKKILNAFTEMPGIFEGMIQGDADAIAEAKRHQERLKRLADSFVEGEVFQAATSVRETPKTPRPPTAGDSFSKPPSGQRPAPAATQTAQHHVRPKPATEVMEYLDDLFAESKIFHSP